MLALGPFIFQDIPERELNGNRGNAEILDMTPTYALHHRSEVG